MIGTDSSELDSKNADSPFEVVDVLSSATSLNSVTFDFSNAPEAESLIASVYLLDLDKNTISEENQLKNLRFCFHTSSISGGFGILNSMISYVFI